MKKVFIPAISLLALSSLSSCNFFGGRTFLDSDQKTCDTLMTNLCTYLAEDSVEKAKSLFAPRLYIIDTFSKDLQDLIEYFNGELSEVIGGPLATGEYSNYDYEEKYHVLEYAVITDVDTYRFLIHYVEKDTRTKDNVGIKDLCVLKLSEDEYPDERYFGHVNGSFEGILVAYPHIKLSD